MNILKRFFISYFPIIVFSVSGKSMEPTLMHGEKIIGISARLVSLKKDDIIICHDPRTKKMIVKRITKIKGNEYFVEGDNKEQSTDSRVFGWLKKKDILAKIAYPKKV